MATTTFWMLETLKRMRVLIGPGVSNWNPPSPTADETKTLLGAMVQGMADVSVPVELRPTIQAFLKDRILVDVAPTFRNVEGNPFEVWEAQLPPGVVQSTLQSVETSLQAQYDDEQAEEPGAQSSGGPPGLNR